jgi:L-cystine transport system substrate-binding protein
MISMFSISSSLTRRVALTLIGGLTLAMTSAGLTAAQDARVIRIATAAESKPLSWGALGVEPQGYEPEVLKAINAKLPQYKFEMEGAADIAQETGLATGKYDMITGGYYFSETRDKQFLIPKSPIGASMMKIYSRKDSGIKEMKDLVGKRIVPVTAGGGVFKFVTGWQEKNPDYKVEISASSAGIPYPNRLQEVQNGKYDALILPSNLGEQTVIEQQKLEIVASEPVVIHSTFVLIHRSEENEALVADVSKALAELRADGTLDTLSQKWFGEDVAKYME